MITATALDLVKLAMKLAGVTAVGQTPLAEDANDCFTLLNSMMQSWSQSRWLVTHLRDIAHQASGQPTYTVGIGGDFDVKKPSAIHSAYVRWNFGQTTAGPTDVPLAIIDTYEEWSLIRLKSLRSYPNAVFYDNADVLLGTLHVWPIANEQYEIHLLVKDRLTAFPSLTTPILLDDEYYEALLYNLAGRVQILYSLPINPGIVQLAKAGLNEIKIANHRVPDLKIPPGLGRPNNYWPAHGQFGVVEGVFTLDEDNLG